MVKKISLTMKIKSYLDLIKATKGVDNVVLTQRDGNPIQHSGIWLSKEELFSICAATSAIYNCGLSLHQNKLKYILIEGKMAKILITPLKNYGNTTINKIIQAQNLQNLNEEFYVAITTKSNVNLGGIFLKIRSSLAEIKKCLILSKNSFKPPMRHYSPEEMQRFLNSIENKDEVEKKERIPMFSLSFAQSSYDQLDNLLDDFSRNTFDLINTFITFEGGFILSSLENKMNRTSDNLEKEATLSQSLFYTADKCAWQLKRMHITSILLECIDEFQFINQIRSAIFSARIAKGRQKLGLLRLVIPKYCNKLEKILKESENSSKLVPPIKIESIFNQLLL